MVSFRNRRSLFSFFRSLMSVNIPANVRSVDENAFAGCGSLKTATVSRSTDLNKDAFPSSCEIVYSDS